MSKIGKLKSSLFSKDTKQTAKGALILTLTLTKEAVDGIPIHGLKGSLGVVLEALKASDVCKTVLVITSAV